MQVFFGHFDRNILSQSVLRGALRYQIRSFLNIVQKRGGDQTHVQKFLEQILYDFKGILAT